VPWRQTLHRKFLASWGPAGFSEVLLQTVQAQINGHKIDSRGPAPSLMVYRRTLKYFPPLNGLPGQLWSLYVKWYRCYRVGSLWLRVRDWSIPYNNSRSTSWVKNCQIWQLCMKQCKHELGSKNLGLGGPAPFIGAAVDH